VALSPEWFSRTVTLNGNSVQGDTVLVVGAGGSIGSELALRVARLRPRRLVLVDRSEERLSRTQQAVAEQVGFPRTIPIVADAADPVSTELIFQRHRPSIVFNLAGYKHLPLSEANPVEAARDNVLTTKALAGAALQFGTECLVLASSDKAVHPSSILGRTKALCERLLEVYERECGGKTRFVALRLGNVFESSGSVARVFSRQIADGGPVTVTHAEMTRYLITIPDAATLLLQAHTLPGPGGVFVAEMGEPVKIAELARQLIESASANGTPTLDIEYVGARPGEKLHEELVATDEYLTSTSHPRLFRVSRPKPDCASLHERLREIERVVSLGNGASVRRLLQ
jgi:FlaA1/EpsC-like NDP-sugar epimerase